MSFELGLCIGLAIFTGIFAYFSNNEKEIGLKWFYLCLSFFVMSFSFHIMKLLATDAGYTSIASILDTFEQVIVIISGLMIFLFFIYFLMIMFDLWFPKKKSFKEKVE